jgi:hypothetical protein
MMCYTSIASQLFILAIADPLSELEQKTDSLCLPKPELLRFAIADLLSGLTNAVDASCLLICDRTQTISTDSIGDIGTYNGCCSAAVFDSRIHTRGLLPSAATALLYCWQESNIFTSSPQ